MKDVLEADPDLEQALPLDPFGSMPHWASLIAGLGGKVPAPDPSYVFLTIDSRPAIGMVTVRLRFHELVATQGTLLIEIRVRSAFPGSEHSRLETIVVNLHELALSGGAMEFSFESYRNAYYAIAGNINDETDAVASHIAITVDRRATPVQHGKEWGWRSRKNSARQLSDVSSSLIGRSMTDPNMPQLQDLLSQPGTPRQCQEQIFLDAMQNLRRDPKRTSENWTLAYILQAVERFTKAEHGTRMLGYVTDESPLLSYFASQGHEIMGMRHVAQGEERPDPGRELRALWVPELCEESEFFEHAHFTTGDIRFPPDNFRDQFDIIWSVGANRVMTQQQFVYFAVASLVSVKPGGLVIHVFDYADGVEAGEAPALSRHDIEQLAVLALSHGNDVAQLRFRHGIPSLPTGSVLPFGVVLLRGGLPAG